MRIRRCVIQQLMGIEGLELKLDADTVLLVGDNGAGKTSVLQALRIGIGAWLAGVDQRDVSAPSIPPGMMRHVVEREGHELVKRRTGKVSRVEIVAELAPRLELVWAVARSSAKSSRTRYRESSEIRDLAQDWTGRRSDQQILPLIAYFGARRTRRSSRRTAGSGPVARTLGYAGALDSSVDVNHLLSRWDRLDRQASRSQGAQSVLVALESCLAKLVPGADSIRYDPSLEEPVISAANGSGVQTFAALSDGFRAVIEFGMDLALRAIQLNPALGADAIRKTPGVVLIDEVGQHLHPSWQIEVLRRLRSAFPKIQLIVTSHSPFVALHRGDAIVIRLSNTEQGVRADPVNGDEVGQTIDAVLRGDAFGPLITWGPELLNAVKARARLLSLVLGSPDADAKQKLAESAATIERLRGVRPTHEEDVIRRLTEKAMGEAPVQDAEAAARMQVLENLASEALEDQRQRNEQG